MNWEILKRPTSLNLIGAVILVMGLAGAAWIYQRAGNLPPGALGYEIVGGKVYPIMPEDSKSYVRNLELYGGKLNVIMDDFRRWVSGLFHGKSLAVMIGCCTVIVSLGFFFAARKLTQPAKSTAQDENENC